MPRQKEFDPERALERAMEVFWEKGYQATSVQDLVERMGINRFSMYDTFGGKRDLFLAALDRYTRLTRDGMLGRLERSDQGLPAIREYLMSAVQGYGGRGGWRGCLMINSAVELAPYDRRARSKVEAHLKRLEDAFQAAVLRARRRGELGRDARPRDVARYLVGATVGLSALARTRPGREALRRYAELVLASL